MYYIAFNLFQTFICGTDIECVPDLGLGVHQLSYCLFQYINCLKRNRMILILTD